MQSNKKTLFQFMEKMDETFYNLLGLQLFWSTDSLLEFDVVTVLTYSQTFERPLEAISDVQWSEP